MHNFSRLIFCGLALFLFLAVPAAYAVTPLWTEPGTVGGELSGVVISEDGSTIITGGDQIISLTPDGRKRWSGWSGTCMDISRQGDYILISRGTNLRLVTGGGTQIWDRNMDITVRDLSLAPDLSMIAAAGGGKVRTLTFSGDAIASNETMTINQVRIIPSTDKVLVTTSKGVLLLDRGLIPDWSLDPTMPQNLLSVAPDGSAFVTASSNRVRMYNTNGSLVWDKQFPFGDSQALAWSRDGSTIVLGLDDKILVLNRNGAQAWMANATNLITGVAVSDNGNTIAAGSLDRNLYVYNRAGTLLGTFTVRNAIKANSVAVTGDGQLIILVAQSAVYGFSRTSFTGGEQGTTTITRTISETPRETTEPSETLTPTRTVTTKTVTLPTPYPTESEPAQTFLPAGIPLAALLVLLFCRKRTG